jgi:hypothetical protein
LWATLVQRKFQNDVVSTYPFNWFTLNVHNEKVDISVPGEAKDTFKDLPTTVTDLRGKWTQFTIHENLSSTLSGYFEIFMNGTRVHSRSGANIQAGDINYNYHYGYYRANEPAPDDTESFGPGTGIIYYSPFMILRGSNPGSVPQLP